MPHPERRRRAQGEQQRQEGLQSRHQRNTLRRIGGLHVHMQPTKQIAVAEHLQLVHHLVVVGLVGTALAAP